MTRIVLSIIFFLGIFLFPWWLSALIALLLLIRYTAYEVLLGGVLFDVLYSAGAGAFFGVPYVGTLFATALFIVFFYFKRSLIWYNS